jgi:ribose transport system permease protein
MAAEAIGAWPTLRVRLPALAQPFWITLALLAISALMWVISPAFRTYDNIYNVSRNFAFIAIMALGEMLVIITGGIDISVGSIMGLVGIVTGIVLQAGFHLWWGIAAGLLMAILCGLINGWVVAHLRITPFVVTLGMLSVARSQALILSNNKMVYKFGPNENTFYAVGGGSLLGIPSVVVVMIVLAVGLALVLKYRAWGRYVYAVGGNERAARLAGLPVERIKISVYVLSALFAGIAAILLVGWLGSVTNALGTAYELRVIAAAVIGGTDMMGGGGTCYGAVVGAALVELVRNALLLAGVDPYWQGTFVGVIIVFAVLLERVRHHGTG